MRNPAPSTQQAAFHLTIPDNAFISNFSLEVGGVEHVARVEERARAEALFEVAVEGEEWGGMVQQDSNDPNRFRVTTSVEGGQKVVFRLAYDELLQRRAAMYHQEIHIDLDTRVEDFRIEVAINESLPITAVTVPKLLQSNEILPKDESENRLAKIETNVDGQANQARVVFAPSREEQGEEGVHGRLVVRYEVDRQGQDSELQVALLLLLLLLFLLLLLLLFLLLTLLLLSSSSFSSSFLSSSFSYSSFSSSFLSSSFSSSSSRSLMVTSCTTSCPSTCPPFLSTPSSSWTSGVPRPPLPPRPYPPPPHPHPTAPRWSARSCASSRTPCSPSSTT